MRLCGRGNFGGTQAALGLPGIVHLLRNSGLHFPSLGTLGFCREWVPWAASGPQVDLHQPPNRVHAVEDSQRQAEVDDGEPCPVAIEILLQSVLKLRVLGRILLEGVPG